MKYLFLFLFSLSCTLHQHLHGARTGFVIVPVADLIGEPIKKKSHADILAWYHALPFCDKGPNSPCYRLHQLVYGEQVEIVGQAHDQLQIVVPHIYYVTATSLTPQTTYWTHKNNIMSVQELQKYGVNPTQFPQPINWRDQVINASTNEITLKKPWKDPVSQQIFSAGTRFVIDQHTTTRSGIHAIFFDAHRKKLRSLSIPRTYCLSSAELSTLEQKKTAFIALLKEWAQQKSIPYVWGGCSFTQQDTLLDCQHPIKTGFDCTGLVARALQMCRIPYFFKNSYTIVHNMKPLNDKQSIKDGDIIWIPGHIMVVSDLKHNLLIEARSYDHGYGCVHEIALGDVFKGIDTYQELTTRYQQHKTILRIDRQGKIRNVYREFKILPLTDLWQKEV